MSIGRAFDDLAAAGLAETRKSGKERHLNFNSEGRALLKAAHSFLRSPVRAVKYIRGVRTKPTWKLAGESALAELTNLSEPKIDTYAVAASDWKAIANQTQSDRGRNRLNLLSPWKRGPTTQQDYPIHALVDRLSLYAQFWNSGDERVSMAAKSSFGALTMVRGIEKFREYFAGHETQYAIIGGTACDLLFDAAGPSVESHQRHRHGALR